MVNKYDNLQSALDRGEEASMRCAGNSMLPILSNPSICTYKREKSYKVGDIVFCRVKGRFIDAHKITAINGERYLISNNHGHDNGWTKTIYGRVISAQAPDGSVKTF